MGIAAGIIRGRANARAENISDFNNERKWQAEDESANYLRYLRQLETDKLQRIEQSRQMRHQQSQDLSYQPVDSMSGIMPVGDSYEYERDPELLDIDRQFNRELRPDNLATTPRATLAANNPIKIAEAEKLAEFRRLAKGDLDFMDVNLGELSSLPAIEPGEGTGDLGRIGLTKTTLSKGLSDIGKRLSSRRIAEPGLFEYQSKEDETNSARNTKLINTAASWYTSAEAKQYFSHFPGLYPQAQKAPYEFYTLFKNSQGESAVAPGITSGDFDFAEISGDFDFAGVSDEGSVQPVPETVVQPFTPVAATGSGNIIKDNKGRVRTVADGTSTGGTPTTVVTPPIDTTAATPAEQPWSPIATPPAMPIQDTTEIGPGYEAQTLMTERDKLSRLANIYRQSGQMDKFDELTTQANAKNLESLVSIGFEGLWDLTNRNNGGKLAGVLSQMTGSQIQIQPMDDGTWDIYFNGNLAQSSTTAELTDYAKTVFNSAYRASQAARLAKFQEYEFEKQIDAKYGIQSKNAEIMSQMMKDIATANNQGDLDKSLEIFKNSLPTDPTADGNGNLWSRSGSTITGIFPRGIIEPGIDGEDDRTVYTKSFNVNQDSNIIQGILANALAK